ncbi:hypothetical protein N7478_011876 [Penicillium angulare]|uniref:uncharacterized protein n=1 Tax=Penicillium angulare TaxID=116970 RepID=UPI0025414758|nr:uncharacterized protein N7478_011876 [Penicillium angulare]KAJ5261281.1 hypothetical protein N7478_011876 [Penicillium angulare]
MSLTDFKVLSFDCYGTLIDWESGILAAFQPLLSRLPANHLYISNPQALIFFFNSIQAPLEKENPNMLYNDVLATCYDKVAQNEGIKTTEKERNAFGKTAGSWPAFSDTVDGLLQLKKHYKLIILSNVDHENIAKTLSGPLREVKFDAIYTAQDIGSYKPAHANFFYLLDNLKRGFGFEKDQLLHTAKSLPADHVPAKQLGLTSAWISRGCDGVSGMGGNLKDFDGKVAYKWRFPSIGAMADAVDKAFLSQDQHRSCYE